MLKRSARISSLMVALSLSGRICENAVEKLIMKSNKSIFLMI
jgi:hypothetical protein